MKARIFRQYDIRGIVGEDLDPGVTEAVGRAFASHVRGATGIDRPRIAVGGDNRESSVDLAAGLIRGITAAGAARMERDQDDLRSRGSVRGRYPEPSVPD